MIECSLEITLKWGLYAFAKSSHWTHSAEINQNYKILKKLCSSSIKGNSHVKPCLVEF